MSWTVIPDNWMSDPAVARLSPEARGVLLSLAVWLNGQWIPRDVIPEDAVIVLGAGIDPEAARAIIAAELVPAHLEPVDGGWAIAPRHPYVLPAEERRRRSAARMAFHQAGGRARAGTTERDESGRMKPRHQQPSSAAGASAGDHQQHSSTLPVPSLPVPPRPAGASSNDASGRTNGRAPSSELDSSGPLPGETLKAYHARMAREATP